MTTHQNHKLKKLPDYLQSQLRVFFTVDVVGSTAYKQKNSQNSELPNLEETLSPSSRKKYLHPQWHPPIADLYHLFGSMFFKEWTSNKIELKDSIGDTPEFWKAIGDEVGFTKRISSKWDIVVAIVAWRKALLNFQKHIIDKYNLNVKSAIWLAGFPIHNTEVVFQTQQSFPSKENSESSTKPLDENDDYVINSLSPLKSFYKNKSKSNLIRDFVGPSIDTGFRIASKASPKKLILSVDLLYLLLQAKEKKPEQKAFQKIRQMAIELINDIGFDGKECFKGVLDGAPYPIFWIDQECIDPDKKEFNKFERQLLGLEGERNADNLQKYCAFFIKLKLKYEVQQKNR